MHLDELIPKIYHKINEFTIKGDLAKVSEVYSAASNIFNLAADKSDQSEFRKKSEMLARLWKDKANLEKAAIGLRVDLNIVDSCSFKSIFINGKHYVNDVIIFPDRVKENWWRKEGHKLCIDDIKEDLEKEKPEVLIVGKGYGGKGYGGKLEILPETLEFFKSSGIELIAENTGEAHKTYNRLSKSKRVVAAFHLAC